MKKLLCPENHKVFNPAYSFKTPASPHHAARLENITIDEQTIIPPQTSRPLIIEGIGGVYVPLTTSQLTIDHFKTWDCSWIIVSKNYIGSINHTLLTIDALKQHNIPIAGLIFNGKSNQDSESAILKISKLPLLARLLPEETINQSTIQRYATLWLPRVSHLIR
jgi:dethiobiotin synthetase